MRGKRVAEDLRAHADAASTRAYGSVRPNAEWRVGLLRRPRPLSGSASVQSPHSFSFPRRTLRRAGWTDGPSPRACEVGKRPGTTQVPVRSRIRRATTG